MNILLVESDPAKRIAELEKAIKDMIAAWESLPGNRYYISSEIEDWLCGTMSENINKLRELVKPPEVDCAPHRFGEHG